MATHVRFASKEGGNLDGALAEPGGSQKVGGVIVVQEWWGLTDHIKALCDRFAEAGFLSLAPDLYEGKLPKTTEQAGQLMMALDKPRAASHIADGVSFVKARPRSNGKVAVVGFCMGGALTLSAARFVEGLSAAVPFYGIPDLAMEEYAKIRVPILAHFAKSDDWAKVSVAQEIQKKVRAVGGRMDLYVYDAGHAFMRATDPQVYSPTQAPVAWERTVEFLKKELA